MKKKKPCLRSDTKGPTSVLRPELFRRPELKGFYDPNVRTLC